MERKARLYEDGVEMEWCLNSNGIGVYSTQKGVVGVGLFVSFALP